MKLGRLGFEALAIIAAASMAGTVLAQDTATSSQGPAGATTGGAAGPAAKPGKKHEVTGKVQSIGKQALTLSSGEQVRITDQTQFLRNGQTISRDQIKPGEQVRAAFEPRGGLAYATRVEVVGGGGGGQQPPGGAPQGGGGQ